ncbi:MULTISPECIES: PP2C family protein-serine/threonine phosphatase [unclassified Streptomyces]|uniref:PP2C family protein-serine/threonine phosphatase n=1 Tax=unclassified Streptomyces TaxID=2593676 RepID=UPI002E2B2A5F|nr:SpoIIE family protein phosphatase [Streptomyces sp. NBC_00223]
MAHDGPTPVGLPKVIPRSRDPHGRRLSAPARPWTGPRSVLLVEDDEGDALLVEEYLAMGPAATPTLLRAVNLAEAVKLLTGGPLPECVLLDLHLPDAFGVDAVTRLLKDAPGAAVVVLTGLSEEDAGLAAVAAGAHEYLSKSLLEPQSLDRAIRYAVQRKEIERANAALGESLMRAEENARLERGLLPTPLLRTDDLKVTTRYRPGRDQALLGGDFYDVVQTEDGTVHVVIGDVSGHGAAEAALGVCLRVAWRSFVLAGTGLADRTALLEQMLVAERASGDVFATVMALEFPPDRRSVRIVRAGHPGLLLRREGEVEWYEPECGPALGLLPGTARWPVTTLPLDGASLVMFTDGLFEWRLGTGTERLGEEGLLALARRHRALNPDAFVDALIGAAEDAGAGHGGLSDDAAVVHVGWSAAS